MFGFNRKKKLSKISELDFLKNYYSRPLRNVKEHKILDGAIVMFTYNKDKEAYFVQNKSIKGLAYMLNTQVGPKNMWLYLSKKVKHSLASACNLNISDISSIQYILDNTDKTLNNIYAIIIKAMNYNLFDLIAGSITENAGQYAVWIFDDDIP